MPVTKSAKRALRSSNRKQKINWSMLSRLEIAVREAKKTKVVEAVRKAISLADRAAKKGVIHRNKSSRIKSSLSKLAVEPKSVKKAPKKK